jgi:hypothetical protein
MSFAIVSVRLKQSELSASDRDNAIVELCVFTTSNHSDSSFTKPNGRSVTIHLLLFYEHHQQFIQSIRRQTEHD